MRRRAATATATRRSPRGGYDDTNLHGASTGKLVQIDDAQPGTAIAEVRWYDPVGRVNQVRRCVDATCMSEATTYDGAGRVAALDYPDAAGNLGTPGAEHVGHAYDGAGRLVRVGPYAWFTCELDDRLASINWTSGAQRFVYAPDRRWLTSTEIQLDEVGILTYGRDAHGRITSALEGGVLFDSQRSYRYDALGRLVEVGSPDPSYRDAMTYDAIGRLRSTAALGAYRYEDPAHVHAMTSTTAGAMRRHDANGNVTELADPSGRHLALTWTPDDQLAGVTDLRSGAIERFAYDVDGHRVK